MSNRENAVKYGGGGGGSKSRINPTPGGFGTTGGMVKNPTTGEYEFSPMSVGHPVLDRIFNQGGASAAASQFNNQMMQSLMLQQLQQKAALAQEHARGEETRKTEVTKGEQDRGTFTKQQVLEIMKNAGVPYTDSNFKTFDDALSKVRIQNAQTAESNKSKVLTDPGFQQAQIQGQTAAAKSPVFDNFQKSQVKAGPDDTTLFDPSMYSSLSPYGKPAELHGAEVNQGLAQGQPIDLGNGMKFPGKEYPVRQVTPGTANFPIDPAILNQAKTMQPPAEAGTNSGVDLTPYSGPGIDALQKLMQQMILQGQQPQQNTNGATNFLAPMGLF